MISSLHNKRVAKAIRLKKRAMREKDRRFLGEGAQAVKEAIVSGSSVVEVFAAGTPEERIEPAVRAARDAGIPVHPVSSEVMGHLTSTVTPQGVVAVSEFVDVALSAIPEDSGLVPILAEVRDPGNAGTILRSADAAGAAAVVFTRSSVDVYNQKAVRASAGSIFHVPVVRETDVGEAVQGLRGRGFAVLAAAPGGEASIHEVDLTRPTAVLFGNEARGLPEPTVALADRTVRVPIAGRAESLNLAAAATLVLFESARQRAGAAGVTGAEAADEGKPKTPAAAAGEALAALVAGAAHDIRSPLAALMGFTSTMLARWDRLDDDQRLAMIDAMAYDAGRMQVLISQLVDAARLASGSLGLAVSPTDLLRVATKVRDQVSRPEFAEVEVAGPSVEAAADPERLRIMLVALVEAAQWWGEEGPVHIEVAIDPEPHITVTRRGTGFDEGAAGDLFAPRRPGAGGGSKVGLFVAKGLADAHGGRLTAAAPGGSVRFDLILPRPGPT